MICKACGYEGPEDIFTLGYCPGCEDEFICRHCGCECPPGGICDDCEDILRGIDNEEAPNEDDDDEAPDTDDEEEPDDDASR